jgi:Flp pilus assembly protein TadG
MKNAKLQKSRGQAMVEMILVLPILFLLAAGIIQFSQLFLAYVQFEHACGEAAREYAGGMIDNDTFSEEIWNNLGAYQPLFDPAFIQVRVEEPTSPLGSWISNNGGMMDDLTRFTKAAHIPAGSIFDYEGQKWNVTSSCKVTPFFGVLFENSITFKTQLAVLRHPHGGNKS